MIRRSRSLRQWAHGEGISYKRALEYVHRALNPLPSRTLHHRHHVLREEAERWLDAEARRQASDIDLTKIVDEIVEAVRGERS